MGTGFGARDDDRVVVDALRAGDEAAFGAVVDRYHASFVRVAQGFVGSRAVAEEVAQDAWIGLLRGIDGFEGRSSLKTWMFRILVNAAKRRARREGRVMPFSDAFAAADATEPSVSPEHFLADDHPRWPGHWASTVADWRTRPEERVLGEETLATVRAALALLPARQRTVVELRDVEDLDSDEVCALLGISQGNQRVLLHRGRSAIRRALSAVLDEEPIG